MCGWAVFSAAICAVCSPSLRKWHPLLSACPRHLSPPRAQPISVRRQLPGGSSIAVVGDDGRWITNSSADRAPRVGSSKLAPFYGTEAIEQPSRERPSRAGLSSAAGLHPLAWGVGRGDRDRDRDAFSSADRDGGVRSGVSGPYRSDRSGQAPLDASALCVSASAASSHGNAAGGGWGAGRVSGRAAAGPEYSAGPLDRASGGGTNGDGDGSVSGGYGGGAGLEAVGRPGSHGSLGASVESSQACPTLIPEPWDRPQHWAAPAAMCMMISCHRARIPYVVSDDLMFLRLRAVCEWFPPRSCAGRLWRCLQRRRRCGAGGVELLVPPQWRLTGRRGAGGRSIRGVPDPKHRA